MTKIEKIREAVANYMKSEGCSCCRDIDGHKRDQDILARLLNVPPYKDNSGFNFSKFMTKTQINFTRDGGKMKDEIPKECREKYWEELSAEQKIGMLADRLEYLQRIVNDQGELIQRLQNHVHVNDKMFVNPDGPVSPCRWPNNNIFNRERKDAFRRLDR